MLHLVPLACARREMTDGNSESKFISQVLKLQLPQPSAIPVTAPAIGGDQKPLGLWIQTAAFRTPPAPNRGNGELSGVMVGTHHNVTPVARQVVDAVRIGAWDIRMGEIVALDPWRFALSMPFAPVVLVVSNEFTVGSKTITFFRPPPKRRTLPGVTADGWRSSFCPRRIVERAKPVMRDTSEMPPRPSPSASVAANKRRALSSSSGANRSNRNRILASVVTP